MAKLSIIVPVYNVKDYLALSLQSARNQTFSDIEIVCVNDGSTDGSRDLLEKFAQVDERFVIIDKQNGGLSSARNAGIKAATSEYICFLDSDDMLVPEACEIIMAAFEATGVDVVTYGATPYPEFMSYYWLDTVLSPRDVVYERFSPALVFDENSRPFAWRTACRRKLLLDKKIFFDERLPFGEDQVFQFALYPRALKTALISDKLVLYRVSREGSLMFSRGEDPKVRLHDHIRILETILKDWKTLGILERYQSEMFAWSVDFLAVDVLSLPDADREEMRHELKAVWERFFSPDFLEKEQVNRVYGFMVAAVLSPSEGANAGSPEVIRLRYYRARDGYFKTLARSYRAVRSIAASRVRRTLRHGDENDKGQSAADLAREEAWFAADEEKRAKATASVLEEAKQKKERGE